MLSIFSFVAISLLGCASWKEYCYRRNYPAGGGALLDTNGVPITIIYPTPTPPIDHQNNTR